MVNGISQARQNSETPKALLYVLILFICGISLSKPCQSAQARIRNVFGGAETFEANFSLGTKTRRAFRASLNTPLTSDMDTIGEVSAYGMDNDLSTYASCTESLRGVRAVVRVS